MKSFLKRALVYSIALMLMLPTWLVSDLLTAPKAYAALTVSGGTSSTTVNSTGTFAILTPLLVNTSEAGDLSAGNLPIKFGGSGLVLQFDTATDVVATPSGNLDLGSGAGKPQNVTPDLSQISVSLVNTSQPGDSVTISGIRVKATSGDGSAYLTANDIASSDQFQVDAQKPTLDSAETMDVDSNGKLDGIKLTFSEAVLDSSVQLSGFSIDAGGYTVNSINTGSIANDTSINLVLGEGENPNTDDTPNVDCSSGAVIDLAGNLIDSDPVTDPLDKAAPVMLWARTLDTTHIGVGFSEDLYSQSIAPSDKFIVTLPDHTVTDLERNSINHNVITLTLDGAQLIASDEKPTVTFDGNIGDLASPRNWVYSGGPMVAADGIDPNTDPYLVSIAYEEGQNTEPEKIIATFSDRMNYLGAPSDYTLEYDVNGVFGGTELTEVIESVTNIGDDSTVELTISDHSDRTDVGGKFRLTIINPDNVQDIAKNGVDPNRNYADSYVVPAFDTPPVVTVNTLKTNDPTPALSGTVNDATATLSLTVNSQTYTPINNADGTWILADNTISSLSDGTYDVVVNATDVSGHVGTDNSTNELTVDSTPPILTVVNIKSNGFDQGTAITGDTVTLTFTASENISVSRVTINGREAVVSGSGQEFTANRVLDEQDPEGNVTFIITFVDLASNVGEGIATSDNSSVTFSKVLILPTVDATVSSVEHDGNRYIRVEWKGVDHGVERYFIVINGVISDFPIDVAGSDLNVSYIREVKIDTYGRHEVIVYAVRGRVLSRGIVKIVEIIAPAVVAPAAPVAPVSAPSAISEKKVTVVPQKAQAQEPKVEEPAPVETPLEQSITDENGVIKGEDQQEKEAVNWTPWVVLFVLIILAGAATGAYFYWFGEEEQVPQAPEKGRVAKREVPKERVAKKSSSKRPKRW